MKPKCICGHAEKDHSPFEVSKTRECVYYTGRDGREKPPFWCQCYKYRPVGAQGTPEMRKAIQDGGRYKREGLPPDKQSKQFKIVTTPIAFDIEETKEKRIAKYATIGGPDVVQDFGNFGRPIIRVKPDRAEENRDEEAARRWKLYEKLMARNEEQNAKEDVWTYTKRTGRAASTRKKPKPKPKPKHVDKLSLTRALPADDDEV